LEEGGVWWIMRVAFIPSCPIQCFSKHCLRNKTILGTVNTTNYSRCLLPRKCFLMSTEKPSADSSETNESPRNFIQSVPRNFVLYLAIATVSLGSLFPLTLKLQGPLLGLGFHESSVLYFDSAPGVSFVILWSLTLFFFRNKAASILRLLASIFVLSTGIYWLVQHSVIAASDEAALVIVSVPTLLYTTFFSWRLRQHYLQGKLPKTGGEKNDCQ
jgi:hypothetical protein